MPEVITKHRPLYPGAENPVQAIEGFAATGDWLRSSLSPVIGHNEVHIWKVDLTREPSFDIEEVLSAEERDRAARYHFHKDRWHFKVARASLRTLLGRYLNVPPADLEFGLGEYGKPFLTNPTATDFRFNLSHSQDIALIAVTRGREVGVDVEFMRPDFATLEVARHFFSQKEIAELKSVAAEFRARAFFNCWSRKEAYIKARGEGLSLALDSFDVSLASDTHAAILASRFDPDDAYRWTMHALFPAPGYSAALAIARSSSSISTQQFFLAE